METSKNTENNKKIARQFIEATTTNDAATLEKLADKNKFKLHFPGNPSALGYNEATKVSEEYSNAFPDTKVTIDFQVAEGEYVVSKVTFNGTHKGTLQGIPASNKKVNTSGTIIQRFENGKVVEEWDEFDTMGMMQQIGAIPETAEHRS